MSEKIEVDENKPKILWFSNSPLCNTGYGTVSRNVVFRLKKAGYPIEVLAYYGQEGFALNFNGLMIYPRLYHPIGRDALELLMKHRYPDILVSLFDIWVTIEQGRSWVTQAHPYTTVYTPVDHTPIPHGVYLGCKDAYQTVAMSKFGYEEMCKVDLRPILIPHGVDTEIFKPQDKAECRKELSLKDNWFIVGVNAANKGPRKRFPDIMAAYQKFVMDNNLTPDDSRLYMNTEVGTGLGGFDLRQMAGQFKINDYIVVTQPFALYMGTTDLQLSKFYNALDVFLNPAMGEGFGLPIIEAEACGVPVIGTKFSSMIELIEGHGWLVDPASYDMSGLLAWQALPNQSQIVEALNDAYQNEDKRRKYGQDSLTFAQSYDYEKVILPQWMKYFDETGEIIRKSETVTKAATGPVSA